MRKDPKLNLKSFDQMDDDDLQEQISDHLDIAEMSIHTCVCALEDAYRLCKDKDKKSSILCTATIIADMRNLIGIMYNGNDIDDDFAKFAGKMILRNITYQIRALKPTGDERFDEGMAEMLARVEAFRMEYDEDGESA